MLSFLLNTFVLIINYSRVRGEVYTYGSSKFGYVGVSRKLYIVKSYLHPRVKIDFRMAIPWFYLPNPDTRGVNRTIRTNTYVLWLAEVRKWGKTLLSTRILGRRYQAA